VWKWDRFASQSDAVNEHSPFYKHERRCYTVDKPVIEHASESRIELAYTSAVGQYRFRQCGTLTGLDRGVENDSIHGKRTRRRSG
jgi:hypothetical protein